MFISLFDALGTIVFAISGVLLASKLRMDPFGVSVLGVVTAIGGGTVRDIILNEGPVFWLEDPRDLKLALLTCVTSIIFIRKPRRVPTWVLPVLDAIGLAVFVGIGVNKSLLLNPSPFIAVCMGVLTGVGGGIIRDTLAREVPLIFRSEIYATACIIGGCAHAVCYYYFHVPLEQAMSIGIFITLTIRLAAIHWNLKLPIF